MVRGSCLCGGVAFALEGDLTGEAFRIGGLFKTSSAELDRQTVLLQLGEPQPEHPEGQQQHRHDDGDTCDLTRDYITINADYHT